MILAACGVKSSSVPKEVPASQHPGEAPKGLGPAHYPTSEFYADRDLVLKAEAALAAQEYSFGYLFNKEANPQLAWRTGAPGSPTPTQAGALRDYSDTLNYFTKKYSAPFTNETSDNAQTLSELFVQDAQVRLKLVRDTLATSPLGTP